MLPSIKRRYIQKTPEPISIVDLPGIYSLSPYTPEEVISRNFILDENQIALLTS